MIAYDIYRGLAAYPQTKIADTFVLDNMVNYEHFIELKEQTAPAGISSHWFDGQEYIDAFVSGYWEDGIFVITKAGTMMDKEWNVIETALNNAKGRI